MANERRPENPYPKDRATTYYDHKIFEEAVDATHKAIMEWLEKKSRATYRRQWVDDDFVTVELREITLEDWRKFKEVK